MTSNSPNHLWLEQLPILAVLLVGLWSLGLAERSLAQTSGAQLTFTQAPQTADGLQGRQIPVPEWSTLPAPAADSTSRESSEGFIEYLEFRDAPLERVVDIFRQESRLNVVVDNSVRGRRVTISLRSISAIAALKELTRQSNTQYRVDRETGVYTIYAGAVRDKNAWDPEALRQFERELNEAFPDSIVHLSAVGSQLLVRGQAHDVVEASRIIRLIDAEAKGKRVTGKEDNARTTPEVSRQSGMLGGLELLQLKEPELTVIDMLTVLGEQQVSLRVTVAEVDRNALRQIGLNFSVMDSARSVFRSTSNSLGTGNLPAMLDNGQIQLAIEALRQMSLAKTLAEPTLTAMNGQAASFHAGGQFPVPIVSGQTVGGLQGVSFVPFGINLQFTPYITDRDRIRLNVSAEVSNRTQGNTAGDQAEIGGATVPGLNMRKFQTIVELRGGQTLAVAGLISSNQFNQADRVPLLGDLPLVGRLAAFDRITAREQELVILVTPELVGALSPMERPGLPGTDVFEPGDVEFYLGGYLEGTRNEDFRSPSRTDLYRQKSFYHQRDIFITGPHGYTECGPMPGAFP